MIDFLSECVGDGLAYDIAYEVQENEFFGAKSPVIGFRMPDYQRFDVSKVSNKLLGFMFSAMCEKTGGRWDIPDTLGLHLVSEMPDKPERVYVCRNYVTSVTCKKAAGDSSKMDFLFNGYKSVQIEEYGNIVRSGIDGTFENSTFDSNLRDIFMNLPDHLRFEMMRELPLFKDLPVHDFLFDDMLESLEALGRDELYPVPDVIEGMLYRLWDGRERNEVLSKLPSFSRHTGVSVAVRLTSSEAIEFAKTALDTDDHVVDLSEEVRLSIENGCSPEEALREWDIELPHKWEPKVLDVTFNDELMLSFQRQEIGLADVWKLAYCDREELDRCNKFLGFDSLEQLKLVNIGGADYAGSYNLLQNLHSLVLSEKNQELIDNYIARSEKSLARRIYQSFLDVGKVGRKSKEHVKSI